MSPILNLRNSLACELICSMFVTGLLTITTPQSHASNNSLPHSFAPTIDESSEATVPQAETVDEATRERVHEAYCKLPLSFEENRGQVDKEVRYISRGAGYTLFLTPTEAVLALQRSDGKKATPTPDARRSHAPVRPRHTRTSVLRMKLKGANTSPAVSGESEMGVRTNYFIGNDPEKWQTDVARYERVRYSQVYPGIDMIYYGQQQQLEYDFEVAPGADTRQIALEFTGVKRVRIERKTGELLLATAGGEVRQHKPVVYQEVGGERLEVASRYVMKGKRKVGVEVGEYDRTKRLVIDPVLSYSTYLGGNNDDFGQGIAVDSSGNAYVTGLTVSGTFPELNEYPVEEIYYYNAFVTKLDTNLSGAAALLYSTYLGGDDYDHGNDIAVDASGIAYVTGYTTSIDFPTVNQYQTDSDGYYSDAFVTKLDTNLSGAASLLYSTYLGGNRDDEGTGIAVDASGTVYVTGQTFSSDFPAINKYQAYQGGSDAFVSKLVTSFGGTQPATISGHVTLDTATGAEFADVTITLTGEEGFTPRTVKTANNGTYAFTGLPTPGNYTLTPSKPYYVFSPTQQSLSYVTTDQLNKNFIATFKTYKISGLVRFGSAGLSGVTVKLISPTPDDCDTLITTTSSTGAYSFTFVPASCNYTLTPTKTGYQFRPASKSFINVSTNQLAVHFSVKVYSIGGRITRTGTTTGISGVTVTITSPTPAGFPARTLQTSSTGHYISGATLPAGRNYTIKPTKSGFTFSPATRSITNLSGNIVSGASTNFTGTGP